MIIDKDIVNLVTCGKMRTGGNWGTGMLIVDNQGNLLLAQRTDNHNWASPGGKVEVSESPLQGVLRETKEESGLTVNNCKFYSYEMHLAPNSKPWTSFMFMANISDCVGDIQPQFSEMGEYQWFTLEDALQLDLFPPTRKSIERAIEQGLLQQDLNVDANNYIPFVNCPTSGFACDSCCCAYSYQEPDLMFKNSCCNEELNEAGNPIWD